MTSLLLELKLKTLRGEVLVIMCELCSSQSKFARNACEHGVRVYMCMLRMYTCKCFCMQIDTQHPMRPVCMPHIRACDLQLLNDHALWMRKSTKCFCVK